MTLVIMPSNIFAHMRGSWSLDPHDPHARSDFDHGPARQRRRFTTSPEYITFTGIVRREMFPAFQYFYDLLINEGADWFIAKVWNGHDYDYQTVRFREAYKATDSHAKIVSISFSLEKKRNSNIREDVYWYLLEYGEDFNWVDRLDPLINNPEGVEPSFSDSMGLVIPLYP